MRFRGEVGRAEKWRATCGEVGLAAVRIDDSSYEAQCFVSSGLMCQQQSGVYDGTSTCTLAKAV